jgi:hypothetical protein
MRLQATVEIQSIFTKDLIVIFGEWKKGTFLLSK